MDFVNLKGLIHLLTKTIRILWILTEVVYYNYIEGLIYLLLYVL